MIRIEARRTIARPIDVVFDRLADVSSYRDWMPPGSLFRDSRWSEPHRAVGPGAAFEERTVFGRLDGRVSEFDPPTKVAFRQILSWRGRRIFESRPGYTLSSTASGTLVVHVAEGGFVGLLAILDSLFWPLARRERVQTVDALEASLQVDGESAGSR
jgi:uncharacterized protein YndB with AHSA1/START domain